MAACANSPTNKDTRSLLTRRSAYRFSVPIPSRSSWTDEGGRLRRQFVCLKHCTHGQPQLAHESVDSGARSPSPPVLCGYIYILFAWVSAKPILKFLVLGWTLVVISKLVLSG